MLVHESVANADAKVVVRIATVVLFDASVVVAMHDALVDDVIMLVSVYSCRNRNATIHQSIRVEH